MKGAMALVKADLLRNDQFDNKQKEWNKWLFWYSFFMALPVILILQNISLYIFLGMAFFVLKNVKSKPLSLTTPLQWVALFFGIGAILSVLNIPSDYSENATERALAVLPNYLYWSVLIIFFITQRRLLNIRIIYKALFWGIILLVIYYFFLQRGLRAIPIFIRQSPNSFSFLLICFTPMAVEYLSKWKGRLWALFFLMVLVLLLLFEGRRAGMVLVLFGGMATLYFKHINFKNIIAGVIAISLFVMLLFTSTAERLIFASSERIHQMIYQTDKITKEDRSYLLRVAMVNKGLAIYEQYPYTGIGLNNFTNFTATIDSDFAGSKYVINKKGINEKSAHNSYISVLAEGGLFLLIPLLLILVLNIGYFLFNFRRIPSGFYPVYIALIAMCIHFYFISAIVNVFAWYLIGLASALQYVRPKPLKKSSPDSFKKSAAIA